MYAYRTPFLRRYCEQPIGPLQAAEDLEQLKVLEMGERMKMCVVAVRQSRASTRPSSSRRNGCTLARSRANNKQQQ
jgi:CMP-2-keto-3-deoxyoctulosonic acid synthetase